MREAGDFHEEVEALAALLDGAGHRALSLPTQFKGWTVEEVIGHLHMFDVGARFSIEDHRDGGDRFARFMVPVAEALAGRGTMMDAQRVWLGEIALGGPALVEVWRDGALDLSRRYAELDPKARLAWAGPDMSARSSVTARQMETWAHGHEVFDVLGVVREEGERLRNIAHLGWVTRGWTFQVRQMAVPEPEPYVRLVSPAGAIWEWGDATSPERIEGPALGFCQTVTQTRAFADTDVTASGPGATAWMQNAQCFAGPPVDPPAPGSRHRAT